MHDELRTQANHARVEATRPPAGKTWTISRHPAYRTWHSMARAGTPDA
ncbi:MAG: hypothetical protein HN742_18715 [Lentisphaerae bacterium]|nr:hypothetical protein [Lentisphaerota bacterium]MBT4820741.1 hypothetical protein [Lentisphaerota bacterium]MBT5604392.1 hypothetical protein [Lentisphaerota bacterium]MBT7059766.1 hypothetical protein [Lentisphaerota bacterium]MBT7843918.1 hypothetical protein [Lentisphaerota bacterium]